MSDLIGTNSAASKQLIAFLERIERIQAEQRELAAQVSDIFSEAKGNGFDVKMMKEILRLRKMEEHDRREWCELLDLYKHAVGMEI